MALAETTVVEMVSGGWPQVLTEPEMLLEADQLAARTRAERLRRREARDDGEGLPRWSRSDGHMSWCPDGTGAFQHEGPAQGPLAGPIRDFANRTSPWEHECDR
jgi:hypothetical protein